MFDLNKIRVHYCMACGQMCPRCITEPPGTCEHCLSPLEGSRCYVEDETRFTERLNKCTDAGIVPAESVWE